MDSAITILIVDDEPAGREALEGVLFFEGYRLLFAENGRDAFQMAIDYLPDVVLLDVMMPQMDGYEVCRMLRADPHLKEIPVLLITALDDRTSRLVGIESGADDFITKPFDRSELRARIRTITRLNRYRRLLIERTKFSWVIEQANDAYLVLNESDQIAYANAAACNILDLPSDGHIDENFFPWVNSHFTCEPEEIWANWPNLDNLNGPLFLIRQGTQFSRSIWLQVEVLRLSAGDDRSILVKITEVTDRLSLEQEIWTFQSMLTHKLLTPFSQISMSTELIARQAKRLTDDIMKELADDILHGTRRIIQEVNDVLGYLNSASLVETGNKFDASGMQALILSICMQLNMPQTRWDGNPLPPGSYLKISDRAMEIILREILENAKKFHPQANPTLDITFKNLDNTNYRLAITDDGIHLPPEQLKRAWVPYYQVEKEFTGEVAGMGLGLSTVSTLIWEVGGKYRMYNRGDRPGIVIELILPALLET
jgi:CheY-like chemotaxis protein